jgi:hypothetical protein
MIRTIIRSAALTVLATVSMASSLAAQEGLTPCTDLLPAQRDVKGKKVGPTACVMTEDQITVEGRAYTRIEIGLDGTVDGYLTKTGDYRGYLTNSPELAFPQTADPGPVFLGIASYGRDKGASMSVLFPADRAAWNGKVWVTVPGASAGPLKPWDPHPAATGPRVASAYDRQMLARGYAIVKTRRATNATALARNATPEPTGITTVLEDGTTADYAAFNDTANYIKDFTVLAEAMLQRKLGKAPTRTYFYGHSAGARIGRSLNYTAGLNTRPDGKPYYDGFFIDDAAAGGWLAVVMKDGKDILFTTEAEKAAFKPQFEVAHQGYNNIWPPKKPGWVSSSYLENKRQNARIMQEKGMSAKFRIYEVRGISHAGSGPGFDIAPMWGQFFAMLDAWADKGVAPPPTRSDWPVLGDPDHDGTVDRAAIAFPQIACPLGVYYTTAVTATTIAFAPFTGQGLEPLNTENIFIDMNRDTVWDFRETPQEAWVRLGLLKKGEPFTREKYVACVEATTSALTKEGFFSTATAADYVEQAKKADLQPKEAPSAAPAATGPAGQPAQPR